MFRKSVSAIIVMTMVCALSTAGMAGTVYADEIIVSEEIISEYGASDEFSDEFSEELTEEIAEESDFGEIIEEEMPVFVESHSEDAYVNDYDDEFEDIFDSDSTDTEKRLTVKLYPQDSKNKSGAYSNYDNLRNALTQASEDYNLTIILDTDSSKGGSSKVFELATYSSGTLNIRSNTTVDLNGHTLLSTGDSLMNTNMFCNSDMNGVRRKVDGCKTGTQYNLSHDITLKNGTLDGNVKSVKSTANLITFGHAQGITVENVTFTHNAANHLLELSGCKDVTINKCKFDGYMYKHTEKYDPAKAEYLSKEAIEIDISSKSYKWTGSYDGDDTVCENITVTNCEFLEYPTGVGDHHAIKGKHTSNVVIANNTFSYKGKVISGGAIRTFAFNNSTISGNKINGNYFVPIRVYGGTGTLVENNTISKSKCDGILVARSVGSKTTEYAKNVSIKGNTIKADMRGIFVLDKSVMGNIDKNTITAKDIAISVNFSTVKSINSNKLKSSGNSAIVVRGAGSKVTTIQKNKLTSPNKEYLPALWIASGAYVKTIKSNTIGASKPVNSIGIRVASSKADNIEANTIISDSKGIMIDTKSTVKKIKGNKVTSNNGEGIAIVRSTINSITDNDIKAKNPAKGYCILNVGGKIKSCKDNKYEYGVAPTN